jgi:hypothetical protein
MGVPGANSSIAIQNPLIIYLKRLMEMIPPTNGGTWVGNTTNLGLTNNHLIPQI